jgi:hypothetical protein
MQGPKRKEHIASTHSCTCTPWRYRPWRTLTSLKTDFHSSHLRTFPLQPLILIFLRSSSTSSSHRILGLPTLFLHSGLLIYSFFYDPVFWHPFCVTLIFYLGAIWGRVVSPRPPFAPVKGPPVPIGQDAGWAPQLVCTQTLEEKSFFCTC